MLYLSKIQRQNIGTKLPVDNSSSTFLDYGISLQNENWSGMDHEQNSTTQIVFGDQTDENC